MCRSLAHGSGMATITACGSGIPLIKRNSSVLSSMALSLPCWFTTGSTLLISLPSTLLPMLSSRASMVSTLPRMVLISPLCRIYRLGWARIQLGLVLVENRLCTMPMAL